MKTNKTRQVEIILTLQKEMVSETVLKEGLSKWIVDEICEFYVSDEEFTFEECKRLNPEIEFLKKRIFEKSGGKEVAVDRYTPKGILQFIADNWMYLITGTPETYQMIADMLVYHDSTCKEYDNKTYEHIHEILKHPGHHAFFTGHFDEALPEKTIIHFE